MSETDPFAAFELDVDHNFDVLATRIVNGFARLDDQAHRNGSDHSDLELLAVRTTIEQDPVQIDFELRPSGLVVVVAVPLGSQGEHLYSYDCDLSSKELLESRAGKHAAAPPLTQIDQMAVIASLLEDTCHEVEAGAAGVVAYGN